MQMGGLSFIYLLDCFVNLFFFKFLVFVFCSDENECIDVMGCYSLWQIDSNLGSDNFGEVFVEFGVGMQQ